MAWVLTIGLGTFRRELDVVFPRRDKTSSGTIGDQAHATGLSGHNPDLTGRAEYRDGDKLDEVRASDEDADLEPGSTIDWMERVVQHIVLTARSGAWVPFHYIIYKARIWSASDGWKTRTYNGANKHDKHAHFSGGRSQKADNWTGSLGLAALRGGETMVDNGWEQTTEHGDGREVSNRLALQNLAELLRLLPDWPDWWFSRWVRSITTKIDGLVLSAGRSNDGIAAARSEITAGRTDAVTQHADLRQGVSVVLAEAQAARAEIADLKAEVARLIDTPVSIDYPSLARAWFDEMYRRSQGGQ